MLRKMRVENPGAIYHIMSRGDRGEKIFLDDVDRQDFLKTSPETCQKTGFNDPGKLSIEARLRRETTLSLKDIAQRVRLGSSRSADATLHRWMSRQESQPTPPDELAKLGI
jgi:hypothetical protein